MATQISPTCSPVAVKNPFWLPGALIGALLSPVALVLLYAKVGVISSSNHVVSHEAFVFYPSGNSPFFAPVLYGSIIVGAANAQWLQVVDSSRRGVFNLLLSLGVGGYCLWNLFDVLLDNLMYGWPDPFLLPWLFTYTPLLLGSLSLLVLALFNFSVVSNSARECFIALCCLGTVGGAILLQLSMWAGLIFARPIFLFMPWFQRNSISQPSSTLVNSIPQVAPVFLVLGACLGLCSMLLCRRERSSFSRILGAVCAVGVAAFTLHILRSYIGFINDQRDFFLCGLLYLAPPLLWSLVLFFASFVVSSRPLSMAHTRPGDFDLGT